MLTPRGDIQIIGEAVSGEEALVQAQRLQPDVVLMDIKMPGMDGIETTRRLREKVPDACVVMLTLYDDEYVTQAIEAGASGYILKDASGEQLIQAIYDARRGYAPLTPSLTREVLTKLANLSRASRDSVLTGRQREILKLVAAGLARKEVAAKLFISEATVKKELTVIFDKLGVSDQTQAVVEALKRRLI
jgi:DNA-binding NarL/FixJ family response regulator